MGVGGEELRQEVGSGNNMAQMQPGKGETWDAVNAATSGGKRPQRLRWDFRSPPGQISSTSNSLSCVWKAQCKQQLD